MLLLVLALLSGIVAVAIALVPRRRGATGRPSWWQDAGAIVLLWLLAAGFYWRLLAGDAYAPAGGGDLASFLYPYYQYAAASLRSGVLPQWNPYVWSGMPFIGDVQNGALYPVNLLQFLLSGGVTYADMQALAVLHVFVAGATAYLCLRLHPDLRLRRGPSLIGAVAFMFSDLFIVHFGNLNMIAVAAWLPLELLLFSLAVHRRSYVLACWAGGVLGLSSLAGHIQPTVYNGLVLAAYAGWAAWSGRRRAGVAAALRPFGLLAAAALVAAVLSAPATLPAIALSGETARAEFTYWQAAQYSLSPLRAIGLVLPDFFGRDPSLYWGLGDRVESGYLGLLPLLLAAVAAVALWRHHAVRFFSLLALGAFVVALGENTPIHGWLYQFVPGMTLLRASARAVYVVDFALAALAAVGAQALVGANRPSLAAVLARFRAALGRYALPSIIALLALSLLAVFLLQDRDAVIFRRAWIAATASSRGLLLLGACLALLAVAPLARPRPGGHGGWLAAALLLAYLDLASVGAYVDISATDPSSGFRHDAAVAFLKSDANPYRVDVDGAAMSLWQPNLGMLYGIEHVRGVANPMELERYRRFLAVAGDRSSPLYDLLGAKYLVVPKGVDPSDASFSPAFAADPGVDIYLNNEALPLALIVHEAVAAAGRDEAQSLLLRPGFRPEASVVLEGAVPVLQPASRPESLWFTRRSAGAIGLATDLSAPAVLVLTVPYSAGWRVTVDGVAATVQPADLAFMAVAVPAGQHEVRFSYAAPYAGPAGAAAAICLFALAATTAVAARRGRSKGTAGEAPPAAA
ncbi:MAG: YfhO family protein [Anaerolineae bacterium]